MNNEHGQEIETDTEVATCFKVLRGFSFIETLLSEVMSPDKVIRHHFHHVSRTIAPMNAVFKILGTSSYRFITNIVENDSGICLVVRDEGIMMKLKNEVMLILFSTENLTVFFSKMKRSQIRACNYSCFDTYEEREADSKTRNFSAQDRIHNGFIILFFIYLIVA
jgi:hypothetical protein